MISRLIARTLIALAVGIAAFLIVGWTVRLYQLIHQGVIGIILIAVAIAAAVWVFDWYTDRTTP